MPRESKQTIPVYDICALQTAGHGAAGFMVERFADYLKGHPNLHKSHGHSFYHFVLFTRGGGFHTIDFHRFPVRAGEAYFMAPGQVHSWAFEGDIDGFVVNFPDSFFASFLTTPQYPETFPFFSGEATDSIVAFDEAQLREAVRLLEDLMGEAGGEERHYLDAVRAGLIRFFILADRAAGGGAVAPQKGGAILQQFRRLLNQYYPSLRMPKDYASLLHVTPNYLNALCNSLLGKSAGTLIRERILLEARRQLVNLDESIAVIGYNLGFADNSYFTKFFKKYTGVTPETFRRDPLSTDKKS